MRNLLIVTTVLLFSASSLMAQGQLKMALKDSSSVDYYIDGKKVDYEIARLLDPAKLGTIKVLKDKASLKKYKAKVGVIWIESDKTTVGEKGKITVRNSKGTIYPMYIIDGEKVERGALMDLDPNDIKDITVVKGEEALKDYNAANGAIIITTKKNIAVAKGEKTLKVHNAADGVTITPKKGKKKKK